jgi:hypothetical protein
MAHSIAPATLQIKRRFAQLIPDDVIVDACCQAAHRWRARRFDPIATIHLFVLQVLNGNTAILHLRHLVCSSLNAAAYYRARMRLPLAVYETLLDYTARVAAQGCAPVFAAMRVFLVDGTATLAPDTASVRKLFHQPANVRRGCGYPMAKVLALFDAASGAILQPLICSSYVHEASRVWALHPLLRGGDLLVGDRAFCSYAHLAMLHARDVLALFSVHQRQKVSFRVGRRHGGTGQPTSRFIRKLGRWDQLLEWLKPKQRPEWMSKKQYDALPPSLIVRELRYALEARGQRTRIVTVVTTLLDPALYPAGKIAELYGLRWKVETHFAQLKTGMKMSQLKCKTAEGVKKELLIYFITYNLIRRVIADAADRQQVPVRRISFIDALRWLAHARDDERSLMLSVIALRPDRHEPRVKKYLKYRYRLMCKPRHILKRRPYLYGDKDK